MRSAAEYVGDAGILLAANVSNAVSNYIDGEDMNSSSHESSVAIVNEEGDIPTEVATEELNPIDREAKEVETETSQPSEEPTEKMEEALPSSQSVEVMNDELHPVESVESVESVEAVESAQPVESVEAVESAQPVESVEPVEPLQPLQPLQPVESTQSTEPSNPSVPPNISESSQETTSQPTSV